MSGCGDSGGLRGAVGAVGGESVRAHGGDLGSLRGLVEVFGGMGDLEGLRHLWGLSVAPEVWEGLWGPGVPEVVGAWRCWKAFAFGECWRPQ